LTFGYTFISTEPLYVKFHDDEWGVPVHNDQKLFELLTLSQALAEHTWPTILSRREEFRCLRTLGYSVHEKMLETWKCLLMLQPFRREMFDRFNFPSVSEFTDKKINLLRSSGSMLLSEQKIRAVVTNAKQMHKVENLKLF
jgi:DNA-3-methyladenine glycosylase I